MTAQEILLKLPYSEPFLFVDEIEMISENGVTGNFTFKKSSLFYNGHFKDNPVTPGVLLTECMAQIGVVCLGIFLNQNTEIHEKVKIGLAGTQIDFFLPVYPGEKVTVVSEKVYFRFNKLKCKVRMQNSNGQLVCKGIISGMIILEKQ